MWLSRREHLFNAVFIYNPNITRKLRQRRPPNRPWRGRRPPTPNALAPCVRVRRGARWDDGPSNVKCHQLVSVSPAIFSISPIVSDGRADEATHASRRGLRGGEAGLTGLILIARGRSVDRSPVLTLSSNPKEEEERSKRPRRRSDRGRRRGGTKARKLHGSRGQPRTHTEFPEKFVQKGKSGDEHDATLGGERG